MVTVMTAWTLPSVSSVYIIQVLVDACLPLPRQPVADPKLLSMTSTVVDLSFPLLAVLLSQDTAASYIDNVVGIRYAAAALWLCACCACNCASAAERAVQVGWPGALLLACI